MSTSDIVKKIESLINGQNKYIITITDKYYQLDTVTGEVVEFPFEQLDNYQTFDIVRNTDNSNIICITSNKNNRYFKDVDGILYTKNMREIVLYPPGIKAESFSIPDGVREINARAFAGVTQLKKITLPNSLVEIEDEAFYGCTGLTEITVPKKVRELGDNIFGEAENLQSVYFEGNLPDAPDPDDIDEFIYASRGGKLIDAISYYEGNKSGWNRIHNTWQGRPVELDSR